MQQHMLAVIDEQISACLEELKILTESDFEYIGSSINGNKQHNVLGAKKSDPKGYTESMLKKYKKEWSVIDKKRSDLNKQPDEQYARMSLLDEINGFMAKLVELKEFADKNHEAYKQISGKSVAFNDMIIDKWKENVQNIDALVEEVSKNVSLLGTYNPSDMDYYLNLIESDIGKFPDLLKTCKESVWIFQSKASFIAETLKLAHMINRKLESLKKSEHVVYDKILQRISDISYTYSTGDTLREKKPGRIEDALEKTTAFIAALEAEKIK
jgi:archaellum component FlaC